MTKNYNIPQNSFKNWDRGINRKISPWERFCLLSWNRGPSINFNEGGYIPWIPFSFAWNYHGLVYFFHIVWPFKYLTYMTGKITSIKISLDPPRKTH